MTSGKERLLNNFDGAPDGENPGGSLVNLDGALYGTTIAGGTSGACPNWGGCGTLFRLIPSSTSESYSVIYSFAGRRNSTEPNGGLLPLGKIFYGTAAGGNRCGSNGTCGTLFAVSTSGKGRVLHRPTGKNVQTLAGWPFVAPEWTNIWHAIFTAVQVILAPSIASSRRHEDFFRTVISVTADPLVAPRGRMSRCRGVHDIGAGSWRGLRTSRKSGCRFPVAFARAKPGHARPSMRIRNRTSA